MLNMNQEKTGIVSFALSVARCFLFCGVSSVSYKIPFSKCFDFNPFDS